MPHDARRHREISRISATTARRWEIAGLLGFFAIDEHMKNIT
jgi:hypothetical protein